MILLDLDPNIVKPGWTPFLITIGLAAVMYLLFRSMRRQFRRVDDNYTIPSPDQAPSTPSDEAAEGEPQPGRDAASAAPSVEESPPRR